MPTHQQMLDAIASWCSRRPTKVEATKVYEIIATSQLFDAEGVEYTDHRGQRVPLGFLSWWTHYPKKAGGMQRCVAVWIEKGLESRSQEMVDALLAQMRHRGVAQQQGAYVANWQDAIRWLKNERWNDVPVSAVVKAADDGAVPALAFDRLLAIALDTDQYPQMAGMDADHPRVLALIDSLWKEESK